MQYENLKNEIENINKELNDVSVYVKSLTDKMNSLKKLPNK